MVKKAVLCLLLLLAACSAETPSAAPTSVNPAADGAVAEQSPVSPTASPVDTATAPPTQPATEPPTAVPTVPPTQPPPPTTTPVDGPVSELSLSRDDVYTYPVPFVVAGEAVTFQVQASIPPTIEPQDVAVRIWVNGEEVVSNGYLGWRNLADEAVGLFDWAWQTNAAGIYDVRVALDPDDLLQEGDLNPLDNEISWQLAVESAPVAGLPTWVVDETKYARVYTVRDTAAYRDRDALLVLIDTAVEEAMASLQAEPPASPLNIFFVERVFGQGGYAGSSIVVTYSDRNYAGGGLYEVLVHETIHVLDNRFEPERPFRFMVEGLAVWATGGHYKQESLNSRAAALLETPYFMSLAPLFDNFYPSQHEVGYLEAGAFVNYLVENYGYERVREFYSQLTLGNGQTPSEAVDAAMQAYFSKTLAQMESDWLVFLRGYPYERDDVADLETTVRLYEVMRRYQQQYDPTAYYLQAWLPQPDTLVERETTAEVTRRAEDETRITLEVMLESADIALRNQDFTGANVILDSIERVLANGTFLDPIAANYLSITRATAELGYEAQKIQLLGNSAQVVATLPGQTELTRLSLKLDPQGWMLAR